MIYDAIFCSMTLLLSLRINFFFLMLSYFFKLMILDFPFATKTFIWNDLCYLGIIRYYWFHRTKVTVHFEPLCFRKQVTEDRINFFFSFVHDAFLLLHNVYDSTEHSLHAANWPMTAPPKVWRYFQSFDNKVSCTT